MSDSNQISKSDSNVIAESQLKLAGSLVLAKRLPKEERASFLMACEQEAKDSTTIFVISLFLGGLGVDRFLLGQTIIGLVKLITLGGCGLWWFIDLFLIMGATKDVNAASAYRIYCQLRD
tara:strand:- start:111 stop:470 length:360 start_codon:yes stop_codon:yes gene_type:complete